VPSAFSSARSTEAARYVLRDDDALLSARFNASAVVRSALPIVPSRELAIAPTSAAGCGAVAGLLASVVVCVVFAIWAHETNTATPTEIASVRLIAVVVVGLLATFSVLMLVRAVALGSKIKAGKPAAEAVWRRAWYCYRCSIVYFQPGEEPPGLRPGQPMVPIAFRHLVWTTGGYSPQRFQDASP
jgi:hypothetical protein